MQKITTQEQREQRNQHLLKTRGYPAGYHSIQEYQEACFKNELIEKECSVCGKTFVQKRSGNGSCSPQCTEVNRLKKIKQTCLEKYGPEHFNRCKKVREKTKKTCMERYGTENPNQSEVVKEKTRKTNKERYGNSCYLGSEKNLKHVKNLMQERFGVDNIFERRDLVEQWWLESLGVDNPQKDKTINEKTFNTRLEKYGELMGAVPKQATEETCMERYGAKTFFGSEAGKMNIDNLVNRYGYDETKLLEFHFAKSPKSSTASKASLKVFIPLYKWCRRQGIQRDDILFGVKGSKEFYMVEGYNVYLYDFTIKSLNLIIEFHGRIFHPKTGEQTLLFGRDAKKVLERDQKKQLLAEQNGYAFLTIWDDADSIDNLETCKNTISTRMKEKIYA